MSELFRAGLTKNEVRTWQTANFQPGAQMLKCRLLSVSPTRQVNILLIPKKGAAPAQSPVWIEVYYHDPVRLESDPMAAEELSGIFSGEEYLRFQSQVQQTLQGLIDEAARHKSHQVIFQRFAFVPTLFLGVPSLAVGLRFRLARPAGAFTKVPDDTILSLKNRLFDNIQSNLVKAFTDHAMLPEGVINPHWKKEHWLVSFGTQFSHSVGRSFLLFLVPKRKVI